MFLIHVVFASALCYFWTLALRSQDTSADLEVEETATKEVAVLHAGLHLERREKDASATNVHRSSRARVRLKDMVNATGHHKDNQYCPPFRYLDGNSQSPKVVHVQIAATDVRESWADGLGYADPYVEFWVGRFGDQERDGWVFRGNEHEWLANTETAHSPTPRYNFGCLFPYHDDDVDRLYIDVVDDDWITMDDFIGMVKDGHGDAGIPLRDLFKQRDSYSHLALHHRGESKTHKKKSKGKLDDHDKNHKHGHDHPDSFSIFSTVSTSSIDVKVVQYEAKVYD